MGFRMYLKKYPRLDLLITYEPLEIFENGGKCWKEEIEHNKILQNVKDWAFWTRPPYTLNTPQCPHFLGLHWLFICRVSPFYVTISPCINPHIPWICPSSPCPKVKFRNNLLLTSFWSDLLKYIWYITTELVVSPQYLEQIT